MSDTCCHEGCCCQPRQDKSPEAQAARKIAYRVRMAAGAAFFAAGLVIEYAPKDAPQWVELAVCLASYLLIGGDVLLRAARNIGRGRIFDENFLMSLSTLGAFAIGEYAEAAAVMLFYQIGEAFQEAAAGKSRRSIRSLLDLRPDTANLLTDAGLEVVAPSDVPVGSRVLVKPGERVPLDGVVLEGNSSLDTAALTGESIPRDAGPGDTVLSGSINSTGLLTIRTEKSAGDSTAAKIIKLVEESGEKKSRAENFITQFARYYTPAVVAVAAALAVLPPLLTGSHDFAAWTYRALVFLVVSCPCALVISIPLSFFGGIGGASRNGILVKGSNFLEALNNVDTVVFDKTGTLTRGVFSVTEIAPAGGLSRDELLRYAALAESNSSHPIAVSIQKAWGQSRAPGSVAGCEEIAGQGLRVTADGKTILAGNSALLENANILFEKADVPGTVVYLAVDGVFAGHIVIADEIKPDSGRAVAELKAMGVKKIVMLTGDSKVVAEKTGAKIGVDMICAELLPHQKVEKLEELEKNRTGKGKLVFVGDGINDAPVLARADVGIAMGGVGSDAAIEAADVVLMTDEPSKIAAAIRIAKKTRGIVWQNILFALGVKAVILVLGAMGIATMWEAVFGDVGVAVIAILNAMRALGKRD